MTNEIEHTNRHNIVCPHCHYDYTGVGVDDMPEDEAHQCDNCMQYFTIDVQIRFTTKKLPL